MDDSMIRRELPKLFFLGLALASAVAQAVPAIPESNGWSGHFNLGVGAGSSESNMLAGIGSIDLGDDTISSLDESAGSEDIVMPLVQFEAAYTLADTRTQFYLGNQVADYLSFDLDTTLETHAGVRQHIPGVGTVDFSYAASALPTDVWKDPYLVDESRGDTERTSKGIHIAWDEIFGTPVEFEYSSREIEIDDERSGEDAALGLTRAQERSLRRTGRINRLDLHYDWKLNDRHRLVPGIGYVDYDLDGDAMAEDGLILQMKYLYELNRWRFVSKVFYHDLESDELNPIYNDERQVETLGGSVTAFFANPFGLKRWTANASVSYYDGDSNIDFYDSNFGLVSVGMFYRFD
jgi:hypothetical protein